MAWERSNRRGRLPGNWAAIRRLVLNRDGWSCQWRIGGRVCGKPANEVHHIVEAGFGADDDRPENLIAICRVHHAQATVRHSAAMRSWRRLPAKEPKHPGLL